MPDRVFASFPTRLEQSPAFSPFTGVRMILDDDTQIVSGIETGRVLEAVCPWATQAMADNILSQISGYRYIPFYAEGVDLDLAAELGDALTIGGIYSIIAEQDTVFGARTICDLSAPQEEELESEYPYLSEAERKVERELAKVNTAFTVLSGQIESAITGPDSALSKISQKVDGLTLSVANSINSSTVKIESGGVEISSSLVAPTGISANSDRIAELDTKINGITLSVSNGSTSSTISLKIGGTTIASPSISMSGLVKFTDLSTADGTTTINGANIKTGTILAGNKNGYYTEINTNTGLLTWNMQNSKLQSNGVFTCIGSYASLRMQNGSIFADRTVSNTTTAVSSIEFTHSLSNITGNMMRLHSDYIGLDGTLFVKTGILKEEFNNADYVYGLGQGYTVAALNSDSLFDITWTDITYITQIQDEGNGQISWKWETRSFPTAFRWNYRRVLNGIVL